MDNDFSKLDGNSPQSGSGNNEKIPCLIWPLPVLAVADELY